MKTLHSMLFYKFNIKDSIEKITLKDTILLCFAIKNIHILRKTINVFHALQTTQHMFTEKKYKQDHRIHSQKHITAMAFSNLDKEP